MNISAATLDVTAMHAQHADYVWLTLQRFGVRDADLEDMLQEVFIVVHQRLHTYDREASLKAWLYGIALRVAAGHRRRAYVRRERQSDHRDPPSTGQSPEGAAVESQERAELRAIMDDMELEKRALFVMYEVDEMSCDQIASVLDVPIGTVYSRLHAARKEFAAAVARWRASQPKEVAG